MWWHIHLHLTIHSDEGHGGMGEYIHLYVLSLRLWGHICHYNWPRLMSYIAHGNSLGFFFLSNSSLIPCRIKSMILALLVKDFGPPSYLVKDLWSERRCSGCSVAYDLMRISVCLLVIADLSDAQAKYKHFNLSGNKLDSFASFCCGCLCIQGWNGNDLWVQKDLKGNAHSFARGAIPQ